jgi:hypothetical protein
MRIGFDLDGTVFDQELGVLRMIDMMDSEKDRQELMQFYCMRRGQNFNPIDYLADDDELFFITGRSILVEALTKRWAKKYYPMATVIVTRSQMPSRNLSLNSASGNVGWYEMQAKLKAKALVENNIEVYFEDAPEVVKILREMVPNCKIIQYGGRCIG